MSSPHNDQQELLRALFEGLPSPVADALGISDEQLCCILAHEDKSLVRFSLLAAAVRAVRDLDGDDGPYLALLGHMHREASR